MLELPPEETEREPLPMSHRAMPPESIPPPKAAGRRVVYHPPVIIRCAGGKSRGTPHTGLGRLRVPSRPMPCYAMLTPACAALAAKAAIHRRGGTYTSRRLGPKGSRGAAQDRVSSGFGPAESPGFPRTDSGLDQPLYSGWKQRYSLDRKHIETGGIER